jgi:hypothetical protein
MGEGSARYMVLHAPEMVRDGPSQFMRPLSRIMSPPQLETLVS